MGWKMPTNFEKLVSNMAHSLSQLKTAIERRLQVVADHASKQHDAQAHLEALKRADADLRAASANLPPDSDPRLRHFLERQSYVKALEWLKESGY